MKIKDVEERTGLSRSNVRFYEKEKCKFCSNGTPILKSAVHSF